MSERNAFWSVRKAHRHHPAFIEILLFVLAALCAYAQNTAIPTQGLRLWLKADAGVKLNSGRVEGWIDQSGAGSSAGQNQPASQPTLIANAINGKPAIRFDGVGDFMTFRLPVNGLTALSIILVSATGQDVNGAWNGVENAPLFWNETAYWGTVHLSPFPRYVKFRFGTGQTGNLPVYTRPNPVFNTFTITTALKNGGTESLFVNGTKVLTVNGKLPTISNVQDQGNLGRGYNNNTYFRGDIAEVLVYTRALSDAERQQVERYLGTKYVIIGPAPINLPPTVKAGPDQAVTLPDTATLNGTASDDGLPSGMLTTTWSQVSGPGTATFAGPNAAKTTASFSAPGTYVLQLTASDGELTAADQVTVTVSPVGAGAISIPTQGLKLWLRADIGVEANGSTVSRWIDQSGNGTHATQAVATNQPTLVPNAVNGKPALRFDGIDDYMNFTLPVNGLTGMTVLLVSATTRDLPSNNEGSYSPIYWHETAGWGMVYVNPLQRYLQWRFGTGQYLNLPTYNRPASIGASYSLTTAIKNATTEAAYVNEDEVLTQAGKLASLANVTDAAYLGRCVYTSTYFPGDLAEILVYTRALTDTERREVEQYLTGKYSIVTAPTPVNQAPTVSAGANQTMTLPASAALSGTASDDGLPNGALTTTWSKVSGPGTVAFGSASALTTTASFSAAGTYVLRLTASDGALSSSSEVTITVNSGGGGAVPGGAIVLNPGDNIQAAINSNPDGAVFYLRAGVHRMQTLTPKNGNRFIGENGAVLSGARLLTSFVREGSYWVATGQTQGPGTQVGSCLSGYPRCTYPEDLFIDNNPLRHVSSLSAVVAGSWYFDYGNDKIYFANDPNGHRVETSVTAYAFTGSASGVTIQNLIIEKYASPAQAGTIYGMSTSNWVIQDSEVRYNHGIGIRTGTGMRILRSKVHHNGQMGMGGGGNNVLVEDNEIAYNNYAGFDWNWEAGGTKFVRTTSLTARNNYVHHNQGPGLWTDGDNRYTLYEYNRTYGNLVAGIFHEISFDATIRYNTVESDGWNSGGTSLWYAAGILVSASSNVEVHGNTVTNCANGIGGLQNLRASYYLKNLYVHDNNVTQNSGVASGIIKNDAYFDASVYTSWGNRWANNSYRLWNVSAPAFQWTGGILNKDQWRAAGNDVYGTFQ